MYFWSNNFLYSCDLNFTYSTYSNNPVCVDKKSKITCLCFTVLSLYNFYVENVQRKKNNRNKLVQVTSTISELKKYEGDSETLCCTTHTKHFW